jgi:hypothetical protein
MTPIAWSRHSRRRGPGARSTTRAACAVHQTRHGPRCSFQIRKSAVVALLLGGRPRLCEVRRSALVRREGGRVGIYVWNGAGACPWEGGHAVHLFFQREQLTPGVYVPTTDKVPNAVQVSSSRNEHEEKFVEPSGAITISLVEPERVTGSISLDGAEMELSGAFDVVRQKGCGGISANVQEDE